MAQPPVHRLAAALCLSIVLFGLGSGRAWAGYRDAIGWTALQSELGAALPDGNNIKVTQVEGLYLGGYRPDPNQFPGRTFTSKSGSSSPYSWHATQVGRWLYGDANSVAPGITNIDNYEATHWTDSGFLYSDPNGKVEPVVETSRIQNHSWIATTLGSTQLNRDAIRRLDYAINRDGFLAVVGMNNGDSNTVPNLLGASFNALGVGLTNGLHSHGTTFLDGTTRKPDIVAPSSPNDATSWSVGLVSGAAAMLLETADKNAALVNARDNSEVMKAILMAGATKSECAYWDRSPSRPLDEVYGAGELNIYNSYHILTAGEYATSPNTNVPVTAWDFDQITSSSNQRTYFIDVPEGYVLRDFSSLVSWNRIVTDGLPNPNDWGAPTAALANLNLNLLTATDFVTGTTVDYSSSTLNVEHIYQAGDLAAGQYALQVTADFGASGLTSSDYALAWRGELAVVSPGDFNLDGQVTGVDFLIWQAHYPMASEATITEGDANGDGAVTGTDFILWQANYEGVPDQLLWTGGWDDLGAGMYGPAVPEPASALMLLAGAALWARRRRG